MPLAPAAWKGAVTLLSLSLPLLWSLRGQKFPNFVFSLSSPKSQRSSPLRLGLIGDPIGFPPKACGNDEVGECLTIAAIVLRITDSSV